MRQREGADPVVQDGSCPVTVQPTSRMSCQGVNVIITSGALSGKCTNTMRMLADLVNGANSRRVGQVTRHQVACAPGGTLLPFLDNDWRPEVAFRADDQAVSAKITLPLCQVRQALPHYYKLPLLGTSFAVLDTAISKFEGPTFATVLPVHFDHSQRAGPRSLNTASI